MPLDIIKTAITIIRNSQFAIRNSQFAIRNSQFAIRNSQFAIRNSQFAIRNSQSAISTVNYCLINCLFSIFKSPYHYGFFSCPKFIKAHQKKAVQND